MPALFAAAAGSLLAGAGGLMSGKSQAKAQSKHYKWIRNQMAQTKAENTALFGNAMGEQRQGLLALLQSQRNQQRMLGQLGAGASEQINRAAQGQLGDINQMALQGGINSRFLGARTGVMQNQALALNQLKSQLAGTGMAMHAGFGQQLAGQRAGMAGTLQNQAQANSQLFGAGGSLATQAAPTGYSPTGDFLSALGQGVNFFAGLNMMNKQAPGAPGTNSSIPPFLQSNDIYWGSG